MSPTLPPTRPLAQQLGLYRVAHGVADRRRANRFADDPADQLGPHRVAVDLTRQLGPSPTRSPTDGVADGVS